MFKIFAKSSEERKRLEERQRAAENKFGPRDKTKALEARNLDIIQHHLNALDGDGIDSPVSACFQDIADIEGKSLTFVGGVLCGDSTPEFDSLSRSLQMRFKAHLDEQGKLRGRRTLIESQPQRAEEQERNGLKVYFDIPSVTKAEKRRLETKYRMETLKAKYSKRIDLSYKIAERKISLRDEYGGERWDALDSEIDVVINKIAQEEGRIDGEYPLEYAQLSDFLKQSFRERHKNMCLRPI